MSLNPTNSTNQLIIFIFIFFLTFYMIMNFMFFNFIKTLKINFQKKNNMKNYNKFI
uniref:ATP synthase subunit 8 n=2 Tax=Aphidoidea TaxID=33385 RepID=Q699N6_SCHGA|nr:ATP synthase F0 subunit 8 [Hormaphis betulae]YP_073299.1 ATP synthase F0 subunit 8 [Schizaphis graminum]AAS00817.1 ATP synthase subunit 8 [Schizaphis graminum]AMJ17080.1 ATP synthase F0 subunit 8 [Hormaphis betulae]